MIKVEIDICDDCFERYYLGDMVGGINDMAGRIFDALRAMFPHANFLAPMWDERFTYERYNGEADD